MKEKGIDLKTVVKLCEQAVTRDIWFNDAECTRRLMSVLSDFGSGLGYQTELEFMTIDMVWWSKGRMVAAIESENVPRTDPINDEWRKLAYVDADIKILVSYCSAGHVREKWLKKAGQIVAGNPRSRDSRYYLILGDQNNWRFNGYRFDNTGRMVEAYPPEQPSII